MQTQREKGHYDDLCETLLKETGASFVLLTVVDGKLGHGCSIACTDTSPHTAEAVSTMLHFVADKLKDDMAQAHNAPQEN